MKPKMINSYFYKILQCSLQMIYLCTSSSSSYLFIFNNLLALITYSKTLSSPRHCNISLMKCTLTRRWENIPPLLQLANDSDLINSLQTKSGSAQKKFNANFKQ